MVFRLQNIQQRDKGDRVKWSVLRPPARWRPAAGSPSTPEEDQQGHAGVGVHPSISRFVISMCGLLVFPPGGLCVN